ncbi:MAG: amino acid permease [[Clostridium] scindens]
MSLADYLLALVPGIPRVPLAVAALTLFFVINLFGVKDAAFIQNILVIILAAALAVFAAVGVFHAASRDICREPSLRVIRAEDGKDSACGGNLHPHLLQIRWR